MGKTTRNNNNSGNSPPAKKAAKVKSTSSSKTARDDLVAQCQHHGLASTGTVAQLKDRLLEYYMNAKQQPQEVVTKKSKTGEAIAKELVCPITLQLPFDPGGFSLTNKCFHVFICVSTV